MLDEGEPADVLEERLDEWKQVKGSDWDRSVTGVVDENAAVGRLVVEDFAGARVLDRMLMYERRIESSLYRTMAELRKEREARPPAESEGASTSEDNLTADQEPATSAKLASFGAEPTAEPVSSVKCQVSSGKGPVSGGGSDFKLHTSHFKLKEEKITPCGVTTNGEGPATQAAAETLHASSFTLHGSFCETNPIPEGVSRWACQSRTSGSLRGMEGAF